MKKLAETRGKDKGHISFRYNHLFLGTSLAVICFMLLFAVVSVVSATTITVNPGESIQAAINSLPPEGGVVELQAGIFDITSEAPIAMKSNVILRGQGMDNTELIYYGYPIVPAPEQAIIYAVDATNFSIEKMYIHSNWTGYVSTDAAFGIHLRNCRNIIISQIKASKLRAGYQSNVNNHGLPWVVDNLTMLDCVFTDNYCGIGNMDLTNSKIQRCTANGHSNHCGFEFNGGCDNNIVENNIAYDNQYGYKFYVGNDNNTWRNNIAYNNGAGIYGQNPGVDNLIINNLFYDNYDHAIGVDGPWSYTVYVESNTIVSNGGDGIFCGGSYSIEAKNNIIVNNSGYGINGANIKSTYNNVWGNTAGNYNGASAGTGDISSNPLFADASGHDFHLKSTAGRWNGTAWVTDSETSPCIDTGDPSSDYSQEPLPNGGRINMGAYGNTAAASKSGGPDTTPPTITVHSPTGTNVPIGTTISTTFNEAMNKISAENAFSISPSVSGSFSWDGNKMIFTPSSNLAYETTYTVNISTQTEDLAGNNLESPHSWQFTTGLECYTHKLVNPGESIQDAINGLCPSGGTIELGAGTHNIGATIEMRSGVTLIGQGMDATKIYGSGTFHVIKIAGDTNVNIQNLSIDTTGKTLNNDGISIDNSSNILISHVKVSNTWSGIQTNRNLISGEYVVDNLTVEDCILTNNTCGMGNLFLVNSKIIRVEASYNDGWDGIEFNGGCDNNLVIDCISHHNTGGGPQDHGHGNGFEVYSACDNNTFRNNVVYANEGHGFSVHRTGESNKIINNICYNNSGDGIRISVRAGDPWSHNVTIESNTIFANGWSGIHLVCNYNVYAKNNIVVANNNYDFHREDIGEGTGTMYLSYNDAINYSGVSPGTGDISVDPLFADPSAGDFHLKSTAERWNGSAWVTDSEHSPCIDAGDPVSEYSNEPAPNGGRINMGAYGNTAEASKSSSEDTTPPVISNVQASVTENTATITWTTDEPSDSQVEYGLTTSYGSSTTLDTNLVTSHSQTITGLTNETTCHYRVKSKDASDNLAVSEDYTFTTLASGMDLVGLWYFDEGSGIIAYDSSGNNNDGTIYGATWTTGKLNSSLEFDGVDDYVEVLDSSSLDSITDEITLIAWIKTPLTGRHTILEKWLYDPEPQRAYVVTIEENGTIQFLLSSDGTYPLAGTGNLESSGKVSQNTWTHITVTSNGSTMKIYINGEQDPDTADSPVGGIHPSTTNLHVGVWQWSSITRSNYFNGVVDEVKIYNRALSAEEIKADYEAELNQPPVADPNGPYIGTEGLAITFDGSGSHDPDGSIVTYKWDFGDGNTATGVNPTHTYAQNGTYTITLTVTDNGGATDTNTTTATIADTEPTADFTATPKSGPEPLTVTFNDISTSYDGIIAWEWDFNNDGVIDSTEQNLTYMYNENGNYTVSLTVYESDGDSDTITKADYISVTITNSPPYKPYNPSPSDGASDIPISTVLNWTGGDPDDGDTVTYDVHFGIDSNPPLVSENQTKTTYDPGILNYNTRYYWRIVAKDEHGASNESEVWSFTTGAADEYIWLEAEDADSLTPDFEIVNDPSASNGKYIQIPEGVGFRASDGEATYNISIDSSDNYVIWGRKIAVTDGDNSFFVQIDDGTEYLWTIALSENWQWDAVNHWGSGEEFDPEIDPVVFNLSAGDHILKIKQREDGTKLDRLLITNNMSYVPADIEDTIPPASISDLQNTTGTTWINWTWTNPSDTDFNHTMVYLNGIFKTNTSDAYYNATELSPDRSYEIETHTVDTYGNVNSTWVNQTAKTEVAPDTTLPVISLQSPENKTYTSKLIPLNFTADEPLDTCLLSVDSTTNQTLPNCQNLSVISREYQSTSGTAAWWHFNDNATDSSGNDNHGTINGATFVDGKFGSALNFAGINEWISVSDSASFDTINKTITIEAWVKPILTGNRNAIIYKYRYSGVNERCFGYEITGGGNVSFVLCENGTYASCQWFDSKGIVENNTWNHVAGTSDGTTMRIYINGEQDPNTYPAPPEIYTNDYSASIGIWQYGESSFDYPFNGEIDELRIMNRCLSEEEIKSDYALGEGSHSVTVYGKDTAGNWNSSIVYFSISTVTNLGSVSGTITYTHNETGIAGVTVNLTNLAGNVIASTMTDTNGNYTFTDIPPGDYNVTASKLRFWSNSTSSVTVTAGASKTANLELWLKGDLNNNGVSADAGDVAMMKDASVMSTTDWRYDLNTNGMFADAGDLAMMRDASVGKIEVLYKS